MKEVTKNLSEHFTLAELTKTNVKIKNVPNEAQVENLKRLCGWLEMLRSEWNKRYGEGNDPIIINSGYRSPAVNKAVGGVPTSNHLTGCAADIRVANMEQLIRYAIILLDYADETGEEFDELLLERNRFGAFWLHFAVKPKGNRHKVLYINA
jgi:uncharacterized protein YcbK (DUF882 family)